MSNNITYKEVKPNVFLAVVDKNYKAEQAKRWGLLGTTKDELANAYDQYKAANPKNMNLKWLHYYLTEPPDSKIGAEHKTYFEQTRKVMDAINRRYNELKSSTFIITDNNNS